MSLWLNRALIVTPIPYTLQTTNAGYQKVLDLMGVPEEVRSDFIMGAGATTHRYSNDNVDGLIVCIAPNKNVTKIQIYALLTHEAVHIWQYIKKDMGETNPSKEFEAYSIQMISQNLIEEYEKQTAPKKKVK
jgi:hypothetical protein